MITLDEAIEILSRPKTMKGTPQDILEAHDMAITALRQLEIIQCKDCKHRDPEDKKCDCGHDIKWQLPRRDDWYCADGERIDK